MKTLSTKTEAGKLDAQIASNDLARAFAELGLDPSTAPDLSQCSKSDPLESPEERVERLICEHLARDLTDVEIEIVAPAMWRDTGAKAIERTRLAWRICTFARRHGIPLRALPNAILPAHLLTSGPSSAIHRWLNAGIFERTEKTLTPLPYAELNRERREELADLVTWEREVRAKSERRKVAKIYETTQPKKERRKTR